jgi:hypothetical protein
MLEATGNRVRTDRLNQNNFFNIPSATADAALLLEGQYADISFRVRGQHSREFDDGHSHRNKVTLQELNKIFHLTDDLTLSVGKRLLSLDQSYIGQPLGFFQKQTDLADPTDSAGRAEGLPMLVLSWADKRAALTAVYSDDLGAERDGFNRGIRQWLLRAGYEFRNLGVSIVTRRASGESTGFGGTFSATLSDDASVYGSFYTARGTLRPGFSRSLLDRPRLVANPREVFGSYRARDGVEYPRAALGAIYTPKDLPKVQLELIYDRRGLSNDDYDRYLDLLEFHESARNAAVPAGVVDLNLALDSLILQSRGARRTYASLNIDHSVDNFNFGGGAYVGLADRSATYYASIAYTFGKGVSGLVSGAATRGRRNGEFGLGPVANIVSAHLKVAF